MANWVGPQNVSQARYGRVWQAVERWWSQGTDLVFPPVCAHCQRETASSAAGRICADCRTALAFAPAGCSRCGSGLKPQPGEAACLKCQETRLYFHRVVRLGVYEGALRRSVLRMKQAHERALALGLGDCLAAACGEDWADLQVDAVVPIPMHWTRKMRRGANSPEAMAERLSRYFQIPLASHLLVRCRRTTPQASLSPSKRLANVRGAFRARSHADLAGARLLLVDDVMTTGATVNEAAKVLARAGASFIGVAVIARAE